MGAVMRHRFFPAWLLRARASVAVACLSLAPALARADVVVESIMYRSPEMAVPSVVRQFPPGIMARWLQAFDRPEIEMRREAALAVVKAQSRGMTGLKATVPMLKKEMERTEQHPSVRLAAARALVELDAKETASVLHEWSAKGDPDLAEVIEPALARWRHGPAREEWLARIAPEKPLRRPAIRAIQCLAIAGDEKAIPRLRELTLSPTMTPMVRLEAARALGTLRTTGGEADAATLATNQTPAGMNARLCGAWTLRRHSGDAAVRQLQVFARDTDPSVAQVALTRLIEIDPTLAEPAINSSLASADAGVRELGVEILFKRPTDDRVRLLGESLSDKHPDVRSKARRSLRELAVKFSPQVIAAGVKALAGSDWRGREQSAFLLAQLDHKPASSRLVEVLRDERPESAIAAAWALRILAVPSTYPKAVEHFKEYYPQREETDWRDRQLCQLAQLFGQARHAPASDALKAVIPPRSPASGRIETRAAGAWAMGLILEGKPDPEIAGLMDGRMNAIFPVDVEHELVRSMCAISLGRMKAIDKLPTIKKFHSYKQPSFQRVSNSCGWAVEQLTGEKVPPPGVETAMQMLWFITPLE